MGAGQGNTVTRSQHLADFISKRREELDIRQTDLTDRINKAYPKKGLAVSNTTISQLERGNLIPRFDIGCVLAEALKVDPNELWEIVKQEYTEE